MTDLQRANAQLLKDSTNLITKLRDQQDEAARGSMNDVIQYFRHKDELTKEEDILMHNLKNDALKMQRNETWF